MARFVEVLGGVFVLGIIAAPDIATGLANTQMDPLIMSLQAVFATLGSGSNGLNLIQMCTNLLILKERRDNILQFHCKTFLDK